MALLKGMANLYLLFSLLWSNAYQHQVTTSWSSSSFFLLKDNQSQLAQTKQISESWKTVKHPHFVIALLPISVNICDGEFLQLLTDSNTYIFIRWYMFLALQWQRNQLIFSWVYLKEEEMTHEEVEVFPVNQILTCWGVSASSTQALSLLSNLSSQRSFSSSRRLPCQQQLQSVMELESEGKVVDPQATYRCSISNGLRHHIMCCYIGWQYFSLVHQTSNGLTCCLTTTNTVLKNLSKRRYTTD